MESPSKRQKVSRVDLRYRHIAAPLSPDAVDGDAVTELHGAHEAPSSTVNEPLLIREQKRMPRMGRGHRAFHHHRADEARNVLTVGIEIVNTVDSNGIVIGRATVTGTSIPSVPSVPAFPSDQTVPAVPAQPTYSLPTVPAYPFTTGSSVASGSGSSQAGASSSGSNTETTPTPTLAPTASTSPADIISSITASNTTISSTSTSVLSSTSLSSTSSLNSTSSSIISSSTSSSLSSATTTSSSSILSTASTAVASGSQYAGGGGSANTATPPAATATSAGSGTNSVTNNGIDTPKVVGGVVGGLAGAAILLALVLLFLKRHKQQQRQQVAGNDGADSQPIAPSGQQMAARSSMVPASAATFFNRFSGASRSTAETSTTGERGFQRISGRKLPSAFSEGMTSEQFAREGTLSGSSFYRDDHGFYGGPGTAAAATSKEFGKEIGEPSGTATMGTKERIMPSPARTPIIHHPDDAPAFGTSRNGGTSPFSPPHSPNPSLGPPRGTLGRSHASQDGSRGSKFTEDV